MSTIPLSTPSQARAQKRRQPHLASRLRRALKHPRSHRACPAGWSGPLATHGDRLVDEILAARRDAIIWDTTKHGKPDMLQLACDACHDFAAEAALVVSNKAATWKVVHGLERLGIPAFGPIWDS